jgi:hypothetical protein
MWSIRVDAIPSSELLMLLLRLNSSWVMLSLGKIEFSPEEDPHVVADCVKVSLYSHSKILVLHVCYSTNKS